ncbi:aldo/keto reductase [Arthrobacter sp. W4I7]|uniref:aldo/keto reductase n=1 Tax=Arthrobacter sp. W4I7 TaxID=3042296 RepID=UPI0027827875|nr:aldo/keto reductase [Arthrobacter sp. W4I7]MDQ0691221.1 aryl-alcohol dehydrogenase-like predicted oxidoreductase [Arthrobacter sp. W4I7]
MADRVTFPIAIGTAKFAFSDLVRSEAVKALVDAVNGGVTLVDTALAYTRPGIESYAEEVVREVIAEVGKDSVTIATKGGHWRRGNDFPVDGSPGALRRHCLISLRTLGVERIDLYQLHHPDPKLPIEESVAALAELRSEGLVATIGLSNVSADQLDRARTVTKIDAVQNRLSVTSSEDLPLAAACRRAGITYLAYQPLNGGANPVRAVLRVAQRHGATPHQVMLAWVIAQGPGIIPIVGATKTRSIREALQAANLQLDAADLADLAGDAL